MGGISTGTGIFSGINSSQIIEQLLSIESRPKLLAQQRIIQLQQQQAAYLDLNSKIGALKTASGAFRVNKVFQANSANSSDPNVLSATASTSATPGTYQFIVDRLVSSQQMLSRGFANSTTSGVNAGTFTFESAQGRLDRDTSLAELNGGAGIQRGKIVITDATNSKSATIDLSRAATVNDVLDAINSASDVNVTARVQDGKFVVTSNVGGNISIANATGSTTATSLGIARTTASSPSVSGSTVYSLAAGTSLSILNDGNGVTLNSQSGNARFDFTVTVGGTAVNVNIGSVYDSGGAVTESAPTSLGGVLDRINAALSTQFGNSDAKAEIGSDGVSIVINDSQAHTIEVAENTVAGSTTAAQLGIVTTSPQVGSLLGRRILGGLNTTLARTLNGGSGIAGDGTITITGRDGVARNVVIDTNSSVQGVLDALNAAAPAAFSAKLNKNGTGIVITDTTNGTGNLIIDGSSAASLGLATVPAGVASATVDSGSLQHQYVTAGTLLSSLRAGQGVGTGKFRITDSLGTTALVTIDENAKSLDDVIRNINGRGTRVKARINGKGDGLELYEEATGGGSVKIKVADESGTVAANLSIAGEATGTGTANVIDGTAEKKVTFLATDTLQQVATKIATAGVGISAAVINDGNGSTPYRLSLTAKNTGTAGRMIVDTGSFDLGLTQIDKGNDARVFYGSTDPAQGVLLTSSRNTLDSVLTGVTIDLKTVSQDPVTLTIARNTEGIETAVNTFVDAFNTLIDRIATQTRYDAESKAKGPLLGDSTALTLRANLFAKIQGQAIGITSSFDQFADVGVTVGAGGKLTVNRDRLRAAMESDPEGVAQLFAAREIEPTGPSQVPGVPGATFNDPNATTTYTSQGLATIIENLADSYVNSVTGTLTRRSQNVTEQIAQQNSRIASFDARLASRRGVLERQFQAMEEAIAKLQTQQSSLGQISLIG